MKLAVLTEVYHVPDSSPEYMPVYVCQLQEVDLVLRELEEDAVDSDCEWVSHEVEADCDFDAWGTCYVVYSPDSGVPLLITDDEDTDFEAEDEDMLFLVTELATCTFFTLDDEDE